MGGAQNTGEDEKGIIEQEGLNGVGGGTVGQRREYGEIFTLKIFEKQSWKSTILETS